MITAVTATTTTASAHSYSGSSSAGKPRHGALHSSKNNISSNVSTKFKPVTTLGRVGGGEGGEGKPVSAVTSATVCTSIGINDNVNNVTADSPCTSTKTTTNTSLASFNRRNRLQRTPLSPKQQQHQQQQQMLQPIPTTERFVNPNIFSSSCNSRNDGMIEIDAVKASPNRAKSSKSGNNNNNTCATVLNESSKNNKSQDQDQDQDQNNYHHRNSVSRVAPHTTSFTNKAIMAVRKNGTNKITSGGVASNSISNGNSFAPSRTSAASTAPTSTTTATMGATGNAGGNSSPSTSVNGTKSLGSVRKSALSRKLLGLDQTSNSNSNSSSYDEGSGSNNSSHHKRIAVPVKETCTPTATTGTSTILYKSNIASEQRTHMAVIAPATTTIVSGSDRKNTTHSVDLNSIKITTETTAPTKSSTSAVSASLPNNCDDINQSARNNNNNKYNRHHRTPIRVRKNSIDHSPDSRFNNGASNSGISNASTSVAGGNDRIGVSPVRRKLQQEHQSSPITKNTTSIHSRLGHQHFPSPSRGTSEINASQSNTQPQKNAAIWREEDVTDRSHDSVNSVNGKRDIFDVVQKAQLMVSGSNKKVVRVNDVANKSNHDIAMSTTERKSMLLSSSQNVNIATVSTAIASQQPHRNLYHQSQQQQQRGQIPLGRTSELHNNNPSSTLKQHHFRDNPQHQGTPTATNCYSHIGHNPAFGTSPVFIQSDTYHHCNQQQLPPTTGSPVGTAYNEKSSQQQQQSHLYSDMLRTQQQNVDSRSLSPTVHSQQNTNNHIDEHHESQHVTTLTPSHHYEQASSSSSNSNSQRISSTITYSSLPTGCKYPIPISPPPHLSIARPAVPSPTFATHARPRIASPTTQPQFSLGSTKNLGHSSPSSALLSRQSPSLSPAGIPVNNSRSSLSPNEHGRSQMSYHDDEVTLTSVGQIIGTSNLTIERTSSGNKFNSNNSMLARNNHINSFDSKNGGYNFHSSSTISDSKSNTSRQARNKQLASLGNGKNEKFRHADPAVDTTGSHRLRISGSSSSDYETDESSGDDEHDQRKNIKSKVRRNGALKESNMSAMSASQITPDVVGTFFEDHQQEANNRHRHHSSEHSRRQGGNGIVNNNVPIKDDETYDYGDRDDDSQGSLSYAQRRQKEERTARKAAAAAAKAEMEGGPFIKTDDVDRYRKSLDTPLSRTAMGVVGAATIGCIVMGPVGLLVGAAAVGIGIGFLQIPDEQRQNMNNKATEAVRHAQESAFHASEKLTNSCVSTYRYSGISEHVPSEVQTCCSGLVGSNGVSTDGGNGNAMDRARRSNAAIDASDLEGTFNISEVGGGGGLGGGVGVIDENDKHHGESSQAIKNPRDIRNNNTSPSQGTNRTHDKKKGKVACLREGKIIPIPQIHSLDPALQPKAWLDVLASVETSYDEKVEAMEEVIILAKDRHRARIFVDEGILDSLMWTIGRYFEKINYNKNGDAHPQQKVWSNPKVTPHETSAARRAAVCCLTLGKSYCAAMHTEGDLLLMSLYERGTVPEERQLAQLLYEVPHHTRATKTDDPTVVAIGQEVFVLKQMTLPQAEELSGKIKALAEGNFGS